MDSVEFYCQLSANARGRVVEYLSLAGDHTTAIARNMVIWKEMLDEAAKWAENSNRITI